MSGLNRISIVVPGSSTNPGGERDNHISILQTLGITDWQLYHYGDGNSGLLIWGYYALGYLISNGIVTVATVTCSGMVNPPSGSNLVGKADPGPGNYSWTALGAPYSIRTSSDGGGLSAPAQNSSGYVWNIPGNSSTAAADFTAAITAVNGQMPTNITQRNYKYVDSVSGAWQVWALWFCPGQANPAATVGIANSNIMYIVTCSGTPHPPTGSPQPAVTLPSFTQTFTTITAPLSFGPMR